MLKTSCCCANLSTQRVPVIKYPSYEPLVPYQGAPTCCPPMQNHRHHSGPHLVFTWSSLGRPQHEPQLNRRLALLPFLPCHEGMVSPYLCIPTLVLLISSPTLSYYPPLLPRSRVATLAKVTSDVHPDVDETSILHC